MHVRLQSLVAFALIIGLLWPGTVLASTRASVPGVTELFFSEYVEGSGFNKALEIFNGTGTAVNLATSSYDIQMFFNGSSTAGLTIALTGTVADNDVYVVAPTNATDSTILAQADQLFGTSWFNGDDAVVLRRSGVIVDVIGQIGFDPGTEWGTGLTSTADNTLRRKDTVLAGDTNGGDVFDPSVEWNGFAQDTFGGLGGHIIVGGNAPVIATCGGLLLTEFGTPAVRSVSASDADGTVIDIAIASVTPAPTPGSISLSGLVPAGSTGGTAMANVNVDASVPVGTYAVLVTATNNDAAPQTGTCTLAVTVNPITPDLVINEIHADPADGLAGDANGDGTRDASQDEFVEIVNNENTDVDVSGWTLSDAVGIRHTFPTNTVVPAGCAIVVFAGGTPTGSFGFSLVQTASTGQLALTNTGDSVTLALTTPSLTTVATYTYGGEGNVNQSLTRSPDVTGATPLVQHTTAAGSGGRLYSPGTRVDGARFAGCALPLRIHDIQGSGATSPYNGTPNVMIEGVVVGDYQNTPSEFGGFYVQEEDSDVDADPLTSEGIFVFDNNFGVNVNVGDVVRVIGNVAEFAGLTELTGVSRVQVLSTGASVTPATVMLPVANLSDWERYEGMRVNLPQDLTVTENFGLGRFGEVQLSANGRLFNPTSLAAPGAPALALQNLNDRRRIILDDGNNQQNIDPTRYPAPGLSASNTLRDGYTVGGLTGVLDFRFGAYRIQPVGPMIFTASNPRPAAPEPVGGTLKVASMNVLNYFSTIDNGTPLCGPAANQDCRGADSAFEFTRQRDKILSAILGLDADVVGLMELENNASASIQDLVGGLNAVAGAGAYAYLNTGTIGGDAIKVGLIYRPADVTPVGAYALLTSAVNPLFDDTLNRPALAQTFMDNATGEKFTVAVNHLKSKGSACPGDPDLGDGQGNCNVTRTNAATALTQWLATDPTGSGDTDFLIMGDLNSYAREDPITAITNAGYVNLIETFLGANAYSFVFQSQSGYLDHALASPSLAAQATGATEWHINADEPIVLDYNVEFKSANHVNTLYDAGPYRSSDHDPLIVGLRLDQTPPETAASVSGTTRACGPNTCFVLNATVALSANEPATTYYQINGGGFQTYSGPFVVTREGTNTIDFYSVDAHGNVEATKSIEVKITYLSTGVLDNFNRPGPGLGASWSGSTGTGSYKIVKNEVDVGTGGPLYWKNPVFGAAQEAFVTLTRIDPRGHHGLLLKVQGSASASWQQGALSVFYRQGVVGVETFIPGQTWHTIASFPMTLRSGDQLGAEALADGTVRVYVNCVFVGQVQAGSFFANKGGRIGVWDFTAADAVFDDFGGGNN